MEADEPVQSSSMSLPRTELKNPLRIVILSKYIEANSNLSLVSATLEKLGCLVACARPETLVDCQIAIPQTEEEPQSSVGETKFSHPDEEPTLYAMYRIQPLVQYKQENTCVYWDVEDYTIEGGLDFVLIHQKIKEVLGVQGYSGEVSVHFFVGRDKVVPPGSDEQIKITILPDRGRRDRYYSMMVHILVWALENRPPSYIIVLSRNVEDETCPNFEALYSDGYGIFLSERKSGWWLVPEESSVQLFPSLLLDPKRGDADALLEPEPDAESSEVVCV